MSEAQIGTVTDPAERFVEREGLVPALPAARPRQVGDDQVLQWDAIVPPDLVGRADRQILGGHPGWRPGGVGAGEARPRGAEAVGFGDEGAFIAAHTPEEFVAAKAQDGTPCTAHIGPDGAGHFVKMVHNLA